MSTPPVTPPLRAKSRTRGHASTRLARDRRRACPAPTAAGLTTRREQDAGHGMQNRGSAYAEPVEAEGTAAAHGPFVGQRADDPDVAAGVVRSGRAQERTRFLLSRRLALSPGPTPSLASPSPDAAAAEPVRRCCGRILLAMPRYDFRCLACGIEFEALVGFSEQATCAGCGAADLERLFSPIAGPDEDRRARQRRVALERHPPRPRGATSGRFPPPARAASSGEGLENTIGGSATALELHSRAAGELGWARCLNARSLG
jgi:putative FmdB family regulatory protein